ncbi:MAG: hypothetical protein KAW17_09730 [Candidatus Eisenbacteria sp.]|nr:hypothetical protein [Candidatus Eisenbacteria bacterium]
MGRNPTLTADRLILTANNLPIGRGAGLDLTEGFGTEPIPELGIIYYEEAVPLRYALNVNMRMFAVSGESMERLGVFPTRDNVHIFPAIDIVAVDKTTGGLLFTVEHCILTSKGLNFGPNAIVGRNASWVGRNLRWGDS